MTCTFFHAYHNTVFILSYLFFLENVFLVELRKGYIYQQLQYQISINGTQINAAYNLLLSSIVPNICTSNLQLVLCIPFHSFSFALAGSYLHMYVLASQVCMCTTSIICLLHAIDRSMHKMQPTCLPRAQQLAQSLQQLACYCSNRYRQSCFFGGTNPELPWGKLFCFTVTQYTQYKIITQNNALEKSGHDQSKICEGFTLRLA